MQYFYTGTASCPLPPVSKTAASGEGQAEASEAPKAEASEAPKAFSLADFWKVVEEKTLLPKLHEDKSKTNRPTTGIKGIYTSITL